MTGKIVLVPFPFDDLSTSKVRPAVCLTEPTGPQRHVVVFITSQAPKKLLGSDVLLSEQTPTLPVCVFLLQYVLHRLLTLSTSLIRRETPKFSDKMK